MIELMSPSSNLLVTIEPPVIDNNDPHNPGRIITKAVQVRFYDGRARVDEETFEKLKDHPAYSGQGGKRRVWRAEEMAGMRGRRPTVVSGAVGTVNKRELHNEPPSSDWDTVGAVQLVKGIEDGSLNVDPDQAFAYERTHRRRLTVLRALTKLMVEDEGDPLAPDRADTTEDPGAFLAAIPDDTQGV